MSKLWYGNVTAISYFNNMGDIKSQTCNNIVCRIWDFMLKTNSGLQQHIYQEQSILRQISILEHKKMLLSGNSILLFFITLLENLENQTYIFLLLKLIYKQFDRYVSQHPKTRGHGYQCLLSYLEQQ